MGSAHTWGDLRRLSLARQFPTIRGRGNAAIVTLLERIGPLQTQTARSSFLGVGARLPGVTKETVTAAFESARIVRGSTLRGTVHTCTPAQHPLLDATTRLGQRTLWTRTLRPERTSLDEVWAGIEQFAATQWRTPEELREHLTSWLVEHESERAAAALQDGAGRYLTFGHGGLVRRPLDGRWDGQGAPAYRWVGANLDARARAARARVVADPGAALVALARLHLSAYGPASRHDIAWWAGVGLRVVDTALEALRPEATVRPGPDGREYWDLADGMPRGRSDVGTRLLPEFDALMVGYQPDARDRFLAPDHAAILWTQANGLLLPPLLHQGRIVGYWRMAGTGRRRRLTVHSFAGEPVPDETELASPVAAVSSALGVEITDIGLTRHDS